MARKIMTALTLDQLRTDLARIHAHGLATTNVLNIQHTANGNVFLETDTSELEAQLALALAERDTQGAAYRRRIAEQSDEITKLCMALIGVQNLAKGALQRP